jgi:hypothetical protein
MSGYVGGKVRCARKLPPGGRADVSDSTRGVLLRMAKLTAVVFAVVADHQHDLPLKDVVVVDQAARDAREVLCRLHLLQLPPEQRARCCRAGRRAGHGRLLHRSLPLSMTKGSCTEWNRRRWSCAGLSLCRGCAAGKETTGDPTLLLGTLTRLSRGKETTDDGMDKFERPLARLGKDARARSSRAAKAGRQMRPRGTRPLASGRRRYVGPMPR